MMCFIGQGGANSSGVVTAKRPKNRKDLNLDGNIFDTCAHTAYDESFFLLRKTIDLNIVVAKAFDTVEGTSEQSKWIGYITRC